MTGRDYLEAIKRELERGRHQHRMGENILGAFGYVRRRSTAIDEINAVLRELGLRADPPVDQNMPLRAPRIRFSLTDSPEVEPGDEEPDEPKEEDGAEEPTADSVTASFRIAELAAAKKPVETIPPTAALSEAYTRMVLGKFSQLVVASNSTPRRQDIKGIVSYQSIAKGLLNGKPAAVRDCLDDTVPIVRVDEDLNDVVAQLGQHDVVLVVGTDHRLQGIVTAWDLAEEFAELVDPFKRIGEVESRLRRLLNHKLGNERIVQFLNDHPSEPSQERDSEGLTIGEMHRIFENPANWETLGLVAMARETFVGGLDQVRRFRNRLMHFKDPLSPEEIRMLTNFCDLVREIRAENSSGGE